MLTRLRARLRRQRARSDRWRPRYGDVVAAGMVMWRAGVSTGAMFGEREPMTCWVNRYRDHNDVARAPAILPPRDDASTEQSR